MTTSSRTCRRSSTPCAAARPCPTSPNAGAVTNHQASRREGPHRPSQTSRHHRFGSVRNYRLEAKQAVKIGIDSYCFHRYFGEVYPEQQAPDFQMNMDDFLDLAKELEVDGVSLESCFFPSYEPAFL